jgi:hypothetical protein
VTLANQHVLLRALNASLKPPVPNGSFSIENSTVEELRDQAIASMSNVNSSIGSVRTNMIIHNLS